MNILCLSDLHERFRLNTFVDGDTDNPITCKPKRHVDLIVIAGDVFNHSQFIYKNRLEHDTVFKEYCTDLFDKLPEIYQCPLIAMPGNHDPAFHIFSQYVNPDLFPLSNSIEKGCYTSKEGVKFWFAPWCPIIPHTHWNYMKSEHDLMKEYENISEDTEVLVTHTPPYGYLDTVTDSYTERVKHVGSRALYKRIQELPKLRYIISGHIHGYSTSLQEAIIKRDNYPDIKIVRACCVDEDYANKLEGSCGYYLTIDEA